jgi:hypothetical protein
MLATLFVLGSIGFWILTAIAIIAISATLEIDDSPSSLGWPSVITIAFGCILYFCGAGTDLQNLGSYIWTHPGFSIFIGCLYLLAGVLWSFGKWRFFVSDSLERMDESSLTWKDTTQTTLMDRYLPMASENKAMIISWLMYWPISIMWFVIRNPFRRLFTYIYDNISVQYDRMAAKMFASAHAKLLAKVEAKKKAELEDLTNKVNKA